MNLKRGCMLTSTKNRLLELIRLNKCDPTDFSLKVNSPASCSVISSRTGLRFDLTQATEDWAEHQEFAIQTNGIAICAEYGDYFSVSDVDINFSGWLDQVARIVTDRSLPDLWAELEEQRKISPGNDNFDDMTTPFTETEKSQIRIAANTFRVNIIATYKPTSAQLAAIDDKLSYLTASVDRLNRFDWKAVAVATVLGIATTLSCDVATGRQLFDMFKATVASAVHLLR